MHHGYCRWRWFIWKWVAKLHESMITSAPRMCTMWTEWVWLLSSCDQWRCHMQLKWRFYLIQLIIMIKILSLHTKYSVPSSAVIAIWLHWKLHNANRMPINEQHYKAAYIKSYLACIEFGYTCMHDTQSTEHHESGWFIRFTSLTGRVILQFR